VLCFCKKHSCLGPSAHEGHPYGIPFHFGYFRRGGSCTHPRTQTTTILVFMAFSPFCFGSSSMVGAGRPQGTPLRNSLLFRLFLQGWVLYPPANPNHNNPCFQWPYKVWKRDLATGRSSVLDARLTLFDLHPLRSSLLYITPQQNTNGLPSHECHHNTTYVITKWPVYLPTHSHITPRQLGHIEASPCETRERLACTQMERRLL
jgi:hypothetical protein